MLGRAEFALRSGGRCLVTTAVAFVLAWSTACALPSASAPHRPVPSEEPDPEPVREVGLTPEQHARLRQGGRVERFVETQRGSRRYVGGVAYLLVKAEPRQVFDVLNQLDTLSQVLPRTRDTRVLERSSDRTRVELEQGNSVVSATFTVFFELEPPEGPHDPRVVRFWLDPSRPHSIDDVWGFFRATRYDDEHALVAVGALVDLGPGLIRMLFEGRIQRSILRMPARIRETVERTYGSSRVAAVPRG